ncbi:MAG TPA: GTPase, partial [Trueperaceae bacterium]|nr:GTPase [Trueperaceae bacterium]
MTGDKTGSSEDSRIVEDAEYTDPSQSRTPAPAQAATADSGPAQEGAEPTRSGFIAIIGKPNVGKSTLLNTMLGVKVAPITPKPQTTRRGVRGIYTHENRQLVFVDTPGMHRGGDTMLDQSMHREIREAIIDVDLILWVVDLRRPPGAEDKDVVRLLSGVPDSTPVFLIGNKVDAAKYPDEALELYRSLYPKAERTIA